VVGDAVQFPFGRGNLRLWRLKNGIPAGLWPSGERRSEICVIRFLGRDPLALPFGQHGGEFAVPGRQLAYLLPHLVEVCVWSEGLIVVVSLDGGHRLGFGGTERGPGLGGVAATQLGVGGHGEPLALVTGHLFRRYRATFNCSR
jgi:hypothetical protein